MGQPQGIASDPTVIRGCPSRPTCRQEQEDTDYPYSMSLADQGLTLLKNALYYLGLQAFAEELWLRVL